MYAWEMIQEALDYIETHLEKEIRIEDLATLAPIPILFSTFM